MYEVLADYYDLFMDKGDWLDFAVRAARGKRGADVGCGSGEATIRLAQTCDVVAIDSSEQMLRVAGEKFRRLGLKIPVIKQNAEQLSLPFKADFITAVCDVVNYMRRPERFFAAAYDNLTEGGMLIFDISSEAKLRQKIGNSVFTCTKDDVTYVWENSLNKRSVDMTVTFFVPCGCGVYKKLVDCQRQYIYSAEELTAMLDKCGFKVKSTQKKDRVYFSAKRKDR